jgi:cell division protein FtsA
MNNDRIVVGLDIGTTKICAIVGKRNEHGKINILGMGKAESYGVERGVVNNIDMTVEAIKKAVKEAELQSGVEIRTVHVGIAGEHIRSSQHRGIITLEDIDREITQHDLQKLHQGMFRLATNPGEEILHVLPQEYTVDGQNGIKEPIGMSGVRLEGNFHIVTGQSSAANNIYKCVRKAGLEAVELVLEPLASSAAVLSDEEMEAGVCLVDIGGGTTDIAIFVDRIIRHTAVIPFGGNTVTNDIHRTLHIMKRHAEELKVQYGSALAASVRNEKITMRGLKDRTPKQIDRKELAHAIQARMTEILEFVYGEIHHSSYANQLVGGIVLTGGGSQLQHMKQLAEHISGMDARIGLPGEHLAKGLVEEVNHPIFATAVGLVIHALDNPIMEEYSETATYPSAGQEIKAQPQQSPVQMQSKPRPKFLDKVKTWVEGYSQSSSNYIE